MNTKLIAVLVSVLVAISSFSSFGCSAGYKTSGWRGKNRFGNYHQPAPAYVAGQQGMPVVVYGPQPAPRPVVAGPGGNVGAIGRSIAGCEPPFRVDVVNETSKFLQLMVDGNPVPINSAGTLPYLPPETRLHVCLAHPGSHTLQGVAYVNRLGQFREVSRFQREIVGASKSVGTPYFTYRLDEADIRRMR